MRFIHAADLHIDSPLRGLSRYPGPPLERLRGATRRALERLVDLALAEQVDFVLLAGDLYDRDWPDFHTGLFVRSQMVRLGQAGIRVFIVQGNHDAHGVITRQVSWPDNVKLFSSRSAETVHWAEIGVAIHGRSFPDRAVPEDLVPDYPPAVPGCFNIGLLHTSLTGMEGHDTYAPTSVAVLQTKGYDYWALGHVHQRQVVSQQPRVVYPGNMQGRHARETGAKGCELVKLLDQHKVVRNGFTKPYARIQDNFFWGHAFFNHKVNPFLQIGDDFTHEIIIARVHLHGFRCAFHVHENGRRTVLQSHIQHAGIFFKGGDVIDDGPTGGKGFFCHLGFHRINGDGNINPACNGFNDRYGSIQLFLLAHRFGKRPGGFSADIQDMGSCRHHLMGPGQGFVQAGVFSPV